MDTVQATRLRPGMVIRHEGELYSVFSLYHRTPGNKRGFVQTKLRGLRSGAMIEHRFSSGDFVERAVLDECEVEFFESKPIGIELPPAVELKVVETEPSVKGATVTNVTKPATLETGLTVQVPPFISAGDLIRVDTSEGTYLERAR